MNALSWLTVPIPGESIVGFVVLAVLVQYNTGGSARVVILYIASRVKYNYSGGQIWPVGQSLTPTLYSTGMKSHT